MNPSMILYTVDQVLYVQIIIAGQDNFSTQTEMTIDNLSRSLMKNMRYGNHHFCIKTLGKIKLHLYLIFCWKTFNYRKLPTFQGFAFMLLFCIKTRRSVSKAVLCMASTYSWVLPFIDYQWRLDYQNEHEYSFFQSIKKYTFLPSNFNTR